MFYLVLGITIFFGVHLVPVFSDFRQRLLNNLGENLYKGLYAAVSVTGLLLIIFGKVLANPVLLWQPLASGSPVSMILMLLAFILLAAFNLPTNIKRYTRHPMLWGVTLWSVAHFLVVGDLASVVLFGGFGVYSLFGMWSANRRGAAKSDVSFPIVNDVIVVIIGFLFFGIFVFLHPYLFGVSVIKSLIIVNLLLFVQWTGYEPLIHYL